MRSRMIPLCALLLAGCLEMDAFVADGLAVSEYALPENTIPSSLIEPVSFDSDDHTLHGYWVTSANAATGATVLYFHGNKHHLDEYWDRVMLLHDIGLNVFIFDYSGYGRSGGTFSEEALLTDAQAALDFALGRVSVDSLGLYGYSLGNVGSIAMASSGIEPLFLIAEAPFASVNALQQGAMSLPWPSGWLTTGSFDNAERIQSIRTPFLLMHGSQDDFVRYRDNGRVVFEQAPDPKRLVLVDGGGHNDLPEIMGTAAYNTLIREWVALSRAR